MRAMVIGNECPKLTDNSSLTKMVVIVLRNEHTKNRILGKQPYCDVSSDIFNVIIVI